MLDRYEAQFVERTTNSRALYERARKLLAGGVAGNNKFMVPHPVYVDSARGARITDVDGNEYIDLLMGAGPLILGHRPGGVVAALEEQVQRGTHYVLPTPLEAELADRIVRHIPYVDRLRFTTTGSEATIMALRAARAYTGREKVAKFDGHFHGHAHEGLSVSSIVPSRFERGRLVPSPDWAGISQAAVANAVVLPFDEPDTAIETIADNAESLAAVVLEPVPFSSLGGIAPDRAMLQGLREITRAHGIVLIYDEVITAFRLGLGGAGTRFGVEPDLVAMGKIIGGGLPLGAYGGNEEIMERVVTPTRRASDQTEKIFQSGTFSANPMSLSAGIATLDELEELDFAALDGRTERLRVSLAAACADLGLAAQVTGVASMLHIHFTAQPIHSHRDAQTADKRANREFCFGLMARGVFWPLLHGGFLSASHSDAEVSTIIDAAVVVLAEMADARRAPVETTLP